MSVIVEMKTLLGEELPLEETLGNLFNFCKETGIDLLSEDLEELVVEMNRWVENSDLSDDERAQLAEFAQAIKRLAFKGAKAAGRVSGAFHRAKAKVRAFGQGVKKAARSGFFAGQHAGARPQSGGKPSKRRSGKPVKRTAKQQAAARKNIAVARKKRRR